MAFKTLAAAAAVAATAGAVLIPSNMVTTDADVRTGDILVNPLHGARETAALSCRSCAVASQGEDGLVWAESDSNTFTLNFAVGEQEDSLNVLDLLNKVPGSGETPSPFYVEQSQPDGDSLRLEVNAFRVEKAELAMEDGMRLSQLQLDIFVVGQRPVTLPSLVISVVQDAEGHAMISTYNTTPAVQTLPAPAEECNMLPVLCEWKAMIADRINSMKSSMRKGCHKHKSNPMAEETTVGKPPHRMRPGRPHPHHHKGEHRPHHHHHHGSHHRMHMFVRRALLMVVVPIFIGLLAGLATYLVGMALGTLAAVVVAKVRGRAPYESVAQDEEEDQIEKGDFKDEPVFEAPPQYEEKEVVENES